MEFHRQNQKPSIVSKSKEAATIILMNVVQSYPHYDRPQAPQNANDKPKYSGTFVITDQATLDKVKTAALAVAVEKWGPTKGPTMVTMGGKGSTIRTDIAGKYDKVPGALAYISARSETQPGMVHRHAGADGKAEKVAPEKIRDTFYAGSRVNAQVVAFTYDKGVNVGIGFALNNVQAWGPGDRLDNRQAADEAFTPDLNAKPADLAALGIA